MKKFAKIGLISAGIIFAIGLVICGICFAIGGKDVFIHSRYDIPISSDYINGNIKLGDTEFHISQDIKEGNIIFKTDYPIYSAAHENTQVCKASDIEDIDFHIIGGETKVETSDTDYFQIKYEGTGRIQYYVSNNTLYIRGFYERNDKVKSSINDDLILYVPESAKLDSYDLEIGAGALECKNITAKDIKLELGAGDVYFENLDAECFDNSIGAGNLEIKHGNVKNLSTEVGLGAFSYKGLVTEDLDAKCGMGSITFAFDDSKEDHNLDIKCAMGSVEIDNQVLSGMSYDKEFDNHSSSNYEIECSMGSIEMSFEK